MEIRLPDNLDFEKLVSSIDIADFEKINSLSLADCNFIYPSAILPLLYLLSNKLKLNPEMPSALKNYLERMNFFANIPYDFPRPTINRNPSQSNFIEISGFNSASNDNEVMGTSNGITQFINKNIQQINPKRILEYGNAELVDNARVHSQADKCFVLGQNYKKSNFIELCITDNGIGIEKSLGDSIEEALKQGVKGINSPGCGNGLYTTSQMILNSQSLNSHLIIYSDQKYALVNSKECTVKPLRNRLWEGTIAILRIGNDIDNSYEQAFNKKNGDLHTPEYLFDGEDDY
jgi:hypothetical protein